MRGRIILGEFCHMSHDQLQNGNQQFCAQEIV